MFDLGIGFLFKKFLIFSPTLENFLNKIFLICPLYDFKKCWRVRSKGTLMVGEYYWTFSLKIVIVNEFLVGNGGRLDVVDDDKGEKRKMKISKSSSSDIIVIEIEHEVKINGFIKHNCWKSIFR